MTKTELLEDLRVTLARLERAYCDLGEMQMTSGSALINSVYAAARDAAELEIREVRKSIADLEREKETTS